MLIVKGVDEVDKLSVRPTDGDIEKVVKTHSNMLFKLCFVILCNNSDAEDAVSETFIRYITKVQHFTDEEHKKAWLIRVATNICKDMHRFRKRNNYINIDDLTNYCSNQKEFEILDDVIKLPNKYKVVIHLFYIEGCKTNEISQILSISPSAVRKRLQYGRERLKMEHGKDDLL